MYLRYRHPSVGMLCVGRFVDVGRFGMPPGEPIESSTRRADAMGPGRPTREKGRGCHMPPGVINAAGITSWCRPPALAASRRDHARPTVIPFCTRPNGWWCRRDGSGDGQEGHMRDRMLGMLLGWEVCLSWPGGLGEVYNGCWCTSRHPLLSGFSPATQPLNQHHEDGKY